MVAALNGSLSMTGPIPNREQHPLLITGTAIGSFGFELEEYQATRQLFETRLGSRLQSRLFLEG